MVQKRLSRPFSNHFPIFLESLVPVTGKAPFKFKNMLLEYEGFNDLISKWWGQLHVPGFASFLVASKLKYLKEKLKVWNKEVFGDIEAKKHKLIELINSLDMKEESSSLSSEELV